MRDKAFVVAVLLILSLLRLGRFGLLPAAAQTAWNGPLEYATIVSATQTSTAVSFGFNAYNVVVINDGSNEIFITFASSTSTTSKFQVNSGETFSARFDSAVQGMGIICSSGETASVRVGAWR